MLEENKKIWNYCLLVSLIPLISILLYGVGQSCFLDEIVFKGMNLSIIIPLEHVDGVKLSEQFVGHLLSNLERLWNVRFLLYGFFLAMISTILYIHFLKDENFEKTKKLFFFGSIIGQVVILMQLTISAQIQGNYSTLDLIFNKIVPVNKLNSAGNLIKEQGFYYFMKHPYLLALILIHISNMICFIYGSKTWDCIASKTKKFIVVIIVLLSLTTPPLIFKEYIDNYSDKYKSAIKYFFPQEQQRVP